MFDTHTAHVSVALLGKQMGCFAYALPSSHKTSSQLGHLVNIPFRKNQKLGVIISEGIQLPEQIKQLREPHWIANTALLSQPTWLAWCWLASYYQVPFYDWLRRWLPRRFQICLSDRSKVSYYRWDNQALALAKLQTKHETELSWLEQSNLLYMDCFSDLQLKMVQAKTKQIQYWKKYKWLLALPQRPTCLFEMLERSPVLVPQITPVPQVELGFSFTQAQQIAYDQLSCILIDHRQHALLEGVTGSGKTRIYQKLALTILKKGEQVLWLVPEVSLVAETLRQLQIMETHCCCWYGQLAESKKEMIWSKVWQGKPCIILGTRSASTLPFRKLGLIIVDEEHDLSYKQLSYPYYHARDCMYLLARFHQAGLLLGSATPSLETLRNVALNRLTSIVLSERFHPVSLPKQQVVPLISRGHPDSILAPVTISAIQQTLEKSEQVLLLLNRRGFAQQWVCQTCKQPVACIGCQKPYIFYKRTARLRCPICQTQSDLPLCCPSCHTAHFFALGIGTERLEEQLANHFPGIPVLRFDRDTIVNLKAFETQVACIGKQDAAILLGTQMLAKGHNFSKVQQVVLLDVDRVFHSLDIRAQERLAQLYVQVSGRAGRFHKQGTFLIQTQYPQQKIFELLQKGGYSACAQYLLQQREQFGCYPYCRLAAVKLNSTRAASILEILKAIQKWVTDTAQGFVSVEYFLEAETIQRQQFQNIGELRIRSNFPKRLQQILTLLLSQTWLQALLKQSQSKLMIDIDPITGG